MDAALALALAKSGYSGGGGVFWVTISEDENTGDYSSDKTTEEIFDAVLAGNYVLGRYYGGEGNGFTILQPSLVIEEIARFNAVNFEEDDETFASAWQITLHNDGSILSVQRSWVTQDNS